MSKYEGPERRNGHIYVTYKWLIGTIATAGLGILVVGAGVANTAYYPKADGQALQSTVQAMHEDIIELKEAQGEVSRDIKEILRKV